MLVDGPARPLFQWEHVGTARSGRGQVLVLVVLGMVALLAMSAIVVDGGNAWAQQRGTQNGTDASAEAGAVVLVQMLSGANTSWTAVQWDTAVNSAVTATAGTSQNNLTTIKAYYTDINGNLVTCDGVTTTDSTQAAVVGACANGVPTGAQGVDAQGTRTFKTYLAGVIGLTSITTPATATAVAGALQSTSSAVLPVTFPVSIDNCDNTGAIVPGTGLWPVVDPAAADASNEAIVPLCKVAPGAVGWPDLGAGTLPRRISNAAELDGESPELAPDQSRESQQCRYGDELVRRQSCPVADVRWNLQEPAVGDYAGRLCKSGGRRIRQQYVVPHPLLPDVPA